MIDFDVIGLQTVGLLIIADTCTDVHVLLILLALHINRIKNPHVHTQKKNHMIISRDLEQQSCLFVMQL